MNLLEFIFLGIALISIVLCGLIYYRLKSSMALLQQQVSTSHEHILTLNEQLKLSKKATTTLIDRIKGVEQKTRVGEMQLDQMAQKSSDEKSYTEAIKRVKKGATAEDLVANCHLMMNEAKLIIMMHGDKS